MGENIARAIRGARLARVSGGHHGDVFAGDVRIEWPELMAFKRSFTDPIPAKREKSLSEDGVATYHGAAKFVRADVVAVNDDTLQAKHVLIATGAEPAKLDLRGEELLVTS